MSASRAPTVGARGAWHVSKLFGGRIRAEAGYDPRVVRRHALGSRSAVRNGDRTRILYLVDRAGGLGGAEQLSMSVVSRLDPERFERFVCFTRSSDPSVDRELRAAGVEIFHLHRSSRYDLRAWVRFIRFLRRMRFDIVHSHKHGANVWGAVGTTIARTPIFFAHEHSWSFEGDRRRILLDRFLISRRATRMIAVSESDRAAMIAVERIDPERIVVLPNGVPSTRVEARHDPRPVAGGAVSVAAVGARPEKRLDLVLRALALVRADGHDVRLQIVGPMSDEQVLRGLVAELGLEGVVSLLGPRRDVREILLETDIAVLGSEREGAPLALLEYMAAGCAIVATSVGGIPTMLEAGVEGVLVPPGDAQALADAIGALVVDEARRAALGGAARERHRRDFSLESVVARTTRLYEDDLRRIAAR